MKNMICPRCGSFISAGDAYCPECGYQERNEEEEDDFYVQDSIAAGSRQKEWPVKEESKECPKIQEGISKSLESEDYKIALMLARDLREYGCSADVGDELKKIRRHYLKKYDDFLREGNRIDANWVFEEYVDIYPYDMTFLSVIAIKARENGNLDLVNRIYDMMDEL